MSSDEIVIVGGGLAGAKAAEGAREAGWEGPIRLVGSEPYLPYERPPLSKGLLLGDDGPQAALTAKDGWSRTFDVRLELGAPVTAIDLAAHTVRIDSADLPYARLVLATGAEPIRPDLPGADLPGVFTLRSLDDALALRDRLVPGARVAVVGASWIGTEVAAVARQRGAEVVLLGRGSVPLEKVLGPEVGGFYGSVHASHGVEVRLGPDVVGIERSGEGDDARAAGVRLSDGSVVEADVVVLGLGVRPSLSLAKAAGLAVEDGVLADATLRTSDRDAWVAGDIASHAHPSAPGGRRVRVEHWGNALNQGLAAGANAAGADRPYELLPYFFSDQYDVGMEYSGWPFGFDETLLRGSLEDGEFVAFQLRDGVVVGGANVNVWDVNEHVQTLIRAARPVRREILADPSVDPADWPRLALA
ncbi:MAG: FAD-dependent oxidoreductase [Microbacteriaceae bacterium]|nr:FAD-dependent oxidoreductase [Microbacteriaceae bacterium]